MQVAKRQEVTNEPDTSKVNMTGLVKWCFKVKSRNQLRRAVQASWRHEHIPSVLWHDLESFKKEHTSVFIKRKPSCIMLEK